jgi:hypothetical protein
MLREGADRAGAPISQYVLDLVRQEHLQHQLLLQRDAKGARQSSGATLPR